MLAALALEFLSCTPPLSHCCWRILRSRQGECGYLAVSSGHDPQLFATGTHVSHQSPNLSVRGNGRDEPTLSLNVTCLEQQLRALIRLVSGTPCNGTLERSLVSTYKRLAWSAEYETERGTQPARIQVPFFWTPPTACYV